MASACWLARSCGSAGYSWPSPSWTGWRRERGRGDHCPPRAHFWEIAPAVSALSAGVCRRCGESREFANLLPEDREKELRKFRLPGSHTGPKPEKEEQMPKTMDHPAVQAKGGANAEIRAEAQAAETWV